MDLSACQHPYEPCVNGSELQLALLSPLAGSRNVFQYPVYFSCAEVCVNDQTGLAADRVDEALFLLQPVTET